MGPGHPTEDPHPRRPPLTYLGTWITLLSRGPGLSLGALEETQARRDGGSRGQAGAATSIGRGRTDGKKQEAPRQRRSRLGAYKDPQADPDVRGTRCLCRRTQTVAGKARPREEATRKCSIWQKVPKTSH